MPDSDDKPVSFRKPPAVETVQGVFFRPLPKFSSAYQGLLWANHFKQEFPRVEERSCLEEISEPFEGQITTIQGMGVRVSDRPESPRLWASSKNGSNVLQIQRNAIAMNWRRETNSSEYVSYQQRSVEFRSKLAFLTQFFSDEELGDCYPTSCWMTYVNHLNLPSLELEPKVVADVFNFYQIPSESRWLPKPDQLAINLTYPISNKQGRLHLQINPAVKPSKEGPRYVIRFELTARGTLTNKTTDSALEWLDLAHKWIVMGFVELTNPIWHSNWERQI